jgi:hypothetical protein
MILSIRRSAFMMTSVIRAPDCIAASEHEHACLTAVPRHELLGIGEERRVLRDDDPPSARDLRYPDVVRSLWIIEDVFVQPHTTSAFPQNVGEPFRFVRGVQK